MIERVGANSIFFAVAATAARWILNDTENFIASAPALRLLLATETTMTHRAAQETVYMCTGDQFTNL